jgi:hypothetical protein
MSETTGGNTGEIERRVADWCEQHPDAGDDDRTAARRRITADLRAHHAGSRQATGGDEVAKNLADFWQWYERLSSAERLEYQPLTDFGRERYPEPNWPEWTLNDDESAGIVRAWPRGIHDPGDRALTGTDRATLAQRVAEYQLAYHEWQQRQ